MISARTKSVSGGSGPDNGRKDRRNASTARLFLNDLIDASPLLVRPRNLRVVWHLGTPSLLLQLKMKVLFSVGRLSPSR